MSGALGRVEVGGTRAWPPASGCPDPFRPPFPRAGPHHLRVAAAGVWDWAVSW